MLQWGSNSGLLCLPPHFPDEATGAQKSNNSLVSGKAKAQARFCLTVKPVPLTMIPNWSVHKHTSFTRCFVLENVDRPNLFSSFHRAGQGEVWEYIGQMNVCLLILETEHQTFFFSLLLTEKFRHMKSLRGPFSYPASTIINLRTFLFVLYPPLDLFHISDIIFHRVLIF